METEVKAKIIEELVRDFFSDPEMYDDDEVTEFMVYNDLGVPLAQGVIYGLIESLTDQGTVTLNETWNQLCLFLGADPEGEYESLDDVILYGDEQ